MKVLWVTNTIFPDLSKELGNQAPVVGGWMYGMAKDLVKNGVDLTVATARPQIKPHHTTIDGIKYFLLNGQNPAIQYDASLEPQWVNLAKDINPDVVHVHGTEYGHGLSLMKACPNLNYVISIQGLISVYARYYNGQIPAAQIKKYATFRDFLKNDNILKAQKMFFLRGEKVEKQYFKLGRHFIGRTQWDLDHTKALNAKAKYHFCNESLRNSFYESRKWSIENKTDYSIFLSQANYPIKGLHQVIKALPIIKREFPQVKLRIAGGNIIKAQSFRDKMALSGYGNYILGLIRKFALETNVEFTGLLNEHEMVEEYLKCHTFICPSSIENSPNSLGEAQLLGAPTIASYVGGTPDMVEHKKSGLLYRYEEIEMLASAVISIFDNDNLALKLSEGGVAAASKRHDRGENLRKTLEIYNEIVFH